MLSPLPRRSGWADSLARSPSRVSLPRKGRRVGLRIVLFEACSAFTRVTACTLALSPIRDTLIEGFSHFVTSMTAPIASGWSVSPGGTCTHWKAPPLHGAHPQETFSVDGSVEWARIALNAPSLSAFAFPGQSADDLLASINGADLFRCSETQLVALQLEKPHLILPGEEFVARHVDFGREFVSVDGEFAGETSNDLSSAAVSSLFVAGLRFAPTIMKAANPSGVKSALPFGLGPNGSVASPPTI
jgi:hypothetical protein